MYRGAPGYPFETSLVWKNASRWIGGAGQAGSDSECDGWRPPVDSFTNLLAKQTARTHPIIIADGVSSARSRPYPIFIMPPGPPYPSAPLYTVFKGATDRTSSLFSRHPASTGYRCLANTGHYPNWIYQSCTLAGRVCHMDSSRIFARFRIQLLWKIFFFLFFLRFKSGYREWKCLWLFAICSIPRYRYDREEDFILLQLWDVIGKSVKFSKFCYGI